MLPIIKEVVMSATTEKTIQPEENKRTVKSIALRKFKCYFFHCLFNHKDIQFSLNLVDGELHLIGPEITFFYN